MAQLDEPYMHYGVQAKKDFYQAVLITLDAAMAYAKRYAELARQMAAKETNPKRKKELERIAQVCDGYRQTRPGIGGKQSNQCG